MEFIWLNISFSVFILGEEHCPVVEFLFLLRSRFVRLRDVVVAVITTVVIVAHDYSFSVVFPVAFSNAIHASGRYMMNEAWPER